MATANHVLLQRITLTASASSVTFDSIPQTGYTDLKLVMSARIAGSTYTEGFAISVNGGTAYADIELYNQNGTAASYGVRNSSTEMFAGHVPSASATANTFGNHEIYIPNYTSTGVKSVSADGTTEHNGTQVYQTMIAGKITNGAAINSLTISSYSIGFVAGSSFSLYGIADVNTTPKSAPKADGGDIIKTDGTYWYHTFTGSGIFKPQLNLTCDYLVVAGGGGGGSGYGAGAGAGGYRTSIGGSTLSLTSQNYAVTVGAGGIGAPQDSATSGTDGSNSTFASITSTGGGAGTSFQTNGRPGGSGGGAGGGGSYSGGAGNTGGYTPVEGYVGGAGSTTGTASGGGGGASGGGGSGVGGQSGSGGNGAANSISGTSVTYAGGGGGGADSAQGVSRGTGGTGGGGNGGVAGSAGAAGTSGTGGGGGGGGRSGGATWGGGNGGSGIVIIRYTVA